MVCLAKAIDWDYWYVPSHAPSHKSTHTCGDASRTECVLIVLTKRPWHDGKFWR